MSSKNFNSIIENIANSIISNVSKEEWFDVLLQKLQEELSHLDDEELKIQGALVIQQLLDNKPSIIRFTKDAFIRFISYIAMGKKEEATLEYIQNQASVEELIAGMEEDASVVFLEAERDKRLREAARLITSIGATGARILIPLLLALL